MTGGPFGQPAKLRGADPTKPVEGKQRGIDDHRAKIYCRAVAMWCCSFRLVAPEIHRLDDISAHPKGVDGVISWGCSPHRRDRPTRQSARDIGSGAVSCNDVALVRQLLVNATHGVSRYSKNSAGTSGWRQLGVCCQTAIEDCGFQLCIHGSCGLTRPLGRSANFDLEQESIRLTLHSSGMVQLISPQVALRRRAEEVDSNAETGLVRGLADEDANLDQCRADELESFGNVHCFASTRDA